MSHQKEKQNSKEHFNFNKPEIKEMINHKRRLRSALFLAHENRKAAEVFGRIVNDMIRNMSLIKKSATVLVLSIVGFIVVAGFAGPSASSVAYAEAKETINRSFERIAVLSEEKRTYLEEKFQERMKFKDNAMHRNFVGMKEFFPEDVEERHEQRKLSLAESLTEAKNAPDLQIISANEMPTTGFIARAGRTLGFKMMRHYDENCPYLPEGVCENIENRAEFHEEMKPASFLIYTNSEGQRVTLGLNANDEPVVKFIQPDEKYDFFSHGRQKSFQGFKGTNKK